MKHTPRTGIITPNGVSLEKHENETVIYFTNRGKNIELIPPSNTPRTLRPDFKMDGLEWEMKSPKRSTRESIERIFDKALRQSCNVIIDLRRLETTDFTAISHLKRCFDASRRVKRLLIITKKQELLDLKK